MNPLGYATRKPTCKAATWFSELTSATWLHSARASRPQSKRAFGFRPAVILRTTSELRDAIARNPFAKRSDLEPSKLLVDFLASDPGAEIREKVLQLKTDPEELRMHGRELYIYFPNGMARPKMSWAVVEKTLNTPGTGRNWNSVMGLLEMAERMEAANDQLFILRGDNSHTKNSIEQTHLSTHKHTFSTPIQ